MADTVIPFDPDRAHRRRKGRDLAPPLPEDTRTEAERHRDAMLSRRVRSARPEARELAAQQGLPDRRAYNTAQIRQHNERLIAAGRVWPCRITWALNAAGQEGPQVDARLGVAEPTVDLWECGVVVPSTEQVAALSRLTGFGIAYFYMPPTPGPVLSGATICGPRSCRRVVPDEVDEFGVLHYGGEPRRTPPASWQGALF